jgi:outer membrane protein
MLNDTLIKLNRHPEWINRYPIIKMYKIMSRVKILFAGGLCFLFHTALLAQQPDSTQRTAPPSNDQQTAPAPATVYSLQQCVDSAVKNNPLVKTAEFAMKVAKVYLHQQESRLLPTLSGYANFLNNGGKTINYTTNTYFNNTFNQGQGYLSGNLELFNAFSVQNFIRQYALAYQADEKDLQAARDVITVNVIQAYLNVLSGTEALATAESQAADTRHRVDLMEIQNKEGSIAPIDLTDAKGQLNASELTVVNTQNALDASKQALSTYMNIPYSPQLKVVPLNNDLTPVIYNATIDQIYQNATRNLASVKAANLHVASAGRSVAAYRGNMFPNLSLTYGAQSNYSTASVGHFRDQVNNNVQTDWGLQMNIPIFNGLQLRTPYKIAKINLEQARFNQNTTMIQLRQSVEQYYVAMTSSFRTYNALNNEVQNYRESYRGAQIKYDAGALPSLNFIIYKTNKDMAELNLISAKYNYILLTKVLDYYQGTLTW